MTKMLTLWLAVYLLELALFISPLWVLRRKLAPVVLCLITISSFWLGFDLELPLQIGLSLLVLFRILNVLRVIKARMHPRYLWKVTTKTTIWLLGLHLLFLWGYLLSTFFSARTLYMVLVTAQLFVALVLLVATVRNIRKLRFRMPKTYLSDTELPTITVAIPARNETKALDECLQSVLANDYPKLEVIVLDDCSQDKTADVIRSYAQNGVRFVSGDPPAERWLAKNQAYHKLYQEANGELILFCGVDVRLEKHAIRSMVNILRDRNKSMISVLPHRDRSAPAAAIVQPMRYWWELALPRRAFNRPPVLSTCWLINRTALKNLGGFGAVSHTIIPEGYFARELIKSDSYSFIRSSGELDVKTVKGLREQRKTALRVHYPQLRRRLELVFLVSVAETIFLLLPFVLLLGAFWWGMGVGLWLTVGSCAVLTLTHVLILCVTNPANMLFGLFNFPIVVLSELLVGYTSMLRYEFFTIEWKDRNICIPVMHVIPKLPPT